MIVTDDFSAFSNRWGHVNTTPGQMTVTTVAGEWLDAGAMFQGEGFGYGTFEFDVAVSHETVGPFALLWPTDYIKSGAELDVFEIRSDGGGEYGATHYDYSPNRAEAYNDQAVIHPQPPKDATQLHTYSVEWSPPSDINPNGALWYAVDGVPYAYETTHVPRSAADGGVNMLPGVGIHLWPEIMDQQTGSNAITLTEFRFKEWRR